ncbi:MAG: hypothetical protein ACHP7N_04655 [Caulobacterales bacterium]
MAHDPSWARSHESRARSKGASSIACILFVGAMAAAFWMGTIWASQAWLN